MRGPSCALGLCGLVALCGCVNNTSAIEGELSLLRRDVRSLHEKLSETELKLERLEGRVTLLGLGGDGKVAPAPKTPVASSKPAARVTEPAEPKISRLAGPGRSLPVVKLSNNPDDPGFQGALDDGSPPIVIKLRGQGEDRLPVDHGVLKKVDPVLDRRPEPSPSPEKKAKRRQASDAEIRAAYEIARAKLRVEKKPARARALLRRFADRFPGTKYADNVAYWLAECDMEEGRFRTALDRFAAMRRSHPRSPKVPYALLRSADARVSLGQQAEAEALLKKVLADYPDSEAADEAKARLAGAEGAR